METHNIEEYSHKEEFNHIKETPEEKKESFWVRFIVIIGVIVVLFFISMAVVKIVPKIFSSIGNLFGGNSIEITLNTNKVKSGESFLLNWKNKTADNVGVYTVNFTCTENVKVEYETNDGKRPVICNTLFPLPENTTSFPFTVTSENTKDTTLNFVMALWDTTTNKEKLTGKSKITVLGTATKTTVATTTGTSTRNTGATSTSSSVRTNSNSNSNAGTRNTSTKTYSGSPDLTVKIVEVGWVDVYDNYQTGTRVPEGQRVMVKLDIRNLGTAPTGTWSLSATLPSKLQYQKFFSSGAKPSVAPGASFILNLAFDDFDPYSPTLIINLTSGADANSANNTDSRSL